MSEYHVNTQLSYVSLIHELLCGQLDLTLEILQRRDYLNPANV